MQDRRQERHLRVDGPDCDELGQHDHVERVDGSTIYPIGDRWEPSGDATDHEGPDPSAESTGDLPRAPLRQARVMDLPLGARDQDAAQEQQRVAQDHADGHSRWESEQEPADGNHRHPGAQGREQARPRQRCHPEERRQEGQKGNPRRPPERIQEARPQMGLGPIGGADQAVPDLGTWRLGAVFEALLAPGSSAAGSERRGGAERWTTP